MKWIDKNCKWNLPKTQLSLQSNEDNADDNEYNDDKEYNDDDDNYWK